MVSLVQVGEYKLAAWTQGADSARAETGVLCKPGKTSPLHCRSEMSGMTGWRAGQLGRLAIIRKDRCAAVLYLSLEMELTTDII